MENKPSFKGPSSTVVLPNVIKMRNINNKNQRFQPLLSHLPLFIQFFVLKKIFFYFETLKAPPPPLLSCSSALRVGDKRNCANEPLKSLNGCGPLTMGQRMRRRTKAGPCPATPPCSDGSERTHERGLDLGLRRHHLAPHWAQQKGQARDTLEPPANGPQNNQELLTTLAIHRPWLIWETHACSSIQFPPSLFIILKAWNYSTPQSRRYILDVGSHKTLILCT